MEARSLSTSLHAASRSAARLRQQEASGDMELHLRRHRPTSRVYTSSTSSRCSSCSSSTRDSSSPCCTTTTTMLTMLTRLASALLRVRGLLHTGPGLRQDFHRLQLTLTRILLKTEALLNSHLYLHLYLHLRPPFQHQHTPRTPPPPTMHTPPPPPPPHPLR